MAGRIFTTAVIVASGKGSRMHSNISKQFLPLCGKEILAHTLQVFSDSECIDAIILVATEKERAEELITQYKIEKVCSVVHGGSSRQESVSKGLQALPDDTDVVMIHDGVRPFVTQEELHLCIETALKSDGAILGVPVKDTIKICSPEGLVLETPPRSSLMQIQTPQTFRKDLIVAAYEQANQEGFLGTDDASVAEYVGLRPVVVSGSYRNIKITTAEDLLIAEAFLQER